MLASDNNYINVEARNICLFYRNTYLRMRRWFGFSYDYWLSDMLELKLLANILNMVVPRQCIYCLLMYRYVSVKIITDRLIYLKHINASIRIHSNNKPNASIIWQTSKSLDNTLKIIIY